MAGPFLNPTRNRWGIFIPKVATPRTARPRSQNRPHGECRARTAFRPAIIDAARENHISWLRCTLEGGSVGRHSGSRCTSLERLAQERVALPRFVVNHPVRAARNSQLHERGRYCASSGPAKDRGQREGSKGRLCQLFVDSVARFSNPENRDMKHAARPWGPFAADPSKKFDLKGNE
jgi:hypothetical protein